MGADSKQTPIVPVTTTPPGIMGTLERLQHIRGAITRLRFIAEKHRHTSQLSGNGDGAATQLLTTIREQLVPTLEYRHHKKGGAPRQHNDSRREKAALVLESVRSHLEQAQAEAADANSPEVYVGMNFHLLVEAEQQLADLVELLDAGKQQPTRINDDLLNDSVAHHIDDFDMTVDVRIKTFLREGIRERNFFSATCTDSDKNAIGMSSVMVLDCVVGVDSAANPIVAIQHFEKKLTFVSSELHTAKSILEASPENPDPVWAARTKDQLAHYAEMEHCIAASRKAIDNLRAEWAVAEDRALEEVRRLRDVAAISFHCEAKRVTEQRVLGGLKRAYEHFTDVCLPFLAPQYHRRHQLTYSNPCSVRIGFRFLNRAKDDHEAFVNILNLNPQFTAAAMHFGLSSLELLEQLDYLFPHRDQVWLNFDEFPEMVKGKRCAIRGRTVLDHERALEEQKEVGGFFIMNGGERILRALLMQRCNVPINIHREKFRDQGPHFSPNAVVFRSKRVSGITTQNYFYYTTRGEVLFSFARKVVWHLPLPLLLFATKQDLTPMSLYQQLTLGYEHDPAKHTARVETLLQHHHKASYGSLTTMFDYLSVLGRMYRQYQQNSSVLRFIPELSKEVQCHQDAWYGLFMMRRHVLPHLNVEAETPDLPNLRVVDPQVWPGPAIVAELDAKFHVLVATVRQLYEFVDNNTVHQGNDVPAFQEVFTPSQVLVGSFEACLNKTMKLVAYRLGMHIVANHYANFIALGDSEARLQPDERDRIYQQLRKYVDLATGRTGNSDSLGLMHRLLTTGNFTLERDEDFYCPQNSGWVVMAEHLNFFRFFEQLRCLHRGKTIAEMRSSEVRKYPCEAYGFICMVHSPDGEDCGVLNHMSVSTIVTNSCLAGTSSFKKISKWLRKEVTTLIPPDAPVADRLIGTLPLWLEGAVVGYIPEADAPIVARNLRRLKAITDPKLLGVMGLVRRPEVEPHNTIEVVLVPARTKSSAGLHVFYESGRLMRPVQLLESSLRGTDAPFPLVFVGTWEQTYLDIAGVPNELVDAHQDLGAKFEFMEQSGTNIVSFTSTTIPFFEHNCSPRNLFQCGLSKQSAGTQLQAMSWRKEAKLFRMFTPQRYLVRTLPMDYYNMDEVSLGVNTVVAVLAYTGYDMDDAIIINQTAVDRGLFNACVTISKIVDLRDVKKDDDSVVVFHNVAGGKRQFPELDENGLPPKRSRPFATSFTRDHKLPTLQDSTPIYASARRFKRIEDGVVHYEYTKHHVTRWKAMDKGESAWIHQIIPLTFDGPDATSALFVFRIPRNPCVGDKFSSRHGQKGTLPLHIRQFDLPFCARSGMTPDVVINPHAFPSRMTVGMILEMIAGKLGASQGRFFDNSPWSTVDEDPVAAQEIGESLVKQGFNRFGREQMICGLSGETMAADVFVGISGYQRLRHQVNDKWQSRARTDSHTFRAVSRTGQPVKGRKRHGGVRVGEMERDGLLSHGISEVVLDRLLHVSDKTKTFICSQCGGMHSIFEKHASSHATYKECRYCGENNSKDENIWIIDIPKVLQLWSAELTGIGVRVAMKVTER